MLKLIGSQNSGCPIPFTKKAETDQELSRPVAFGYPISKNGWTAGAPKRHYLRAGVTRHSSRLGVFGGLDLA